ncbi:MAG TPA: hypothetical protein VMV40_08665 [Acidiferrobacter sp.]|nr:hypothetical protein [Acidiferrobacter sp.]
MPTARCAACRRSFRVRPQVRAQRYCSAPACQCVRRKRWQSAKRRTDPDYRENQARAQEAWRDGHPDYWRTYRKTHDAYTRDNRDKQARRDQSRRLAKMDVSTANIPVVSGRYRLSPATDNDLAKSDACTVELTVLSMG